MIDTNGNINYAMFGETSVFGKKEEELDKKIRKAEVVDCKKGDKKLQAENGSAEVYISSSSIQIGTNDSGIHVSDNQVQLHGRLAIPKPPSQIRINGFWTFNEEILTTLPSTLFTPIQTLLYSEPPYAKTASKVCKTITSFG